MDPNRQIPAYGWTFGDVNPPVHAWATWRVYKIEQKKKGKGDHLPAPITLSELCQGLNKSQRTIYRVFQECFGLPPMEYLKILCLHGVRRALKSADYRTSTACRLG